MPRDLRAVRIFFGLALGVVLAVDRGPLLGHLAGGQPQPETEEVARDGMQLQRAVRLVAVQVDGDAGDRDVRDDQRVRARAPPGEVEQPLAGSRAGIQQGQFTVIDKSGRCTLPMLCT